MYRSTSRWLLLAALQMVAAEASAQDLGATRLPPLTYSTASDVTPTSSLVDLRTNEPILNCQDSGVYQPMCRGWFDDLSIFAGLDGSKQPQDFGINAHFGGRAALNWGMPLVEAWGLGFQIGTAIDATGNAVQVVERTEGSGGRTQSFTTVGLFQRLDSGWSWGAVYDFLHEDYYDQFNLGQWRLNVGYDLTEPDRVGIWSTFAGFGDSGVYFGTPVDLAPISQNNIYWNHEWKNHVQTTFWGGVCNAHGQVNWALGDLNRLYNTFVFGSELYIPLTDRLAIFGQGNFIMPADSGTVDAYLGFVYYPQGGVWNTRRSHFAPLQTVAAPTNFAVDLRR